MALEPEIKKAMAEAARLIQDLLQAQAPVAKRGGGSLRDSVRVLGGEGKGGNIVFRSKYKDYGVYLDYGTGPFDTYPKRGPFRRNPGSGVGQGGIKSRYWTSLDDTTRLRVRDIMKRATEQIIKTQLKRVKLK